MPKSYKKKENKKFPSQWSIDFKTSHQDNNLLAILTTPWII